MTQIIGLGGYATSGKDAVADFLVEHGGWEKTYMSKPLERALLILNPFVYRTVQDEGSFQETENTTDGRRTPGWKPWERYSELHDRVGYEQSKKNPEVRRLLQILGTEVGREMFGNDVWVDLMADDVRDIVARGKSAVITGIRYENELRAIRNMGGRVVWVSRPGTNPVNAHTSDNSLIPGMFDDVIANNGTLEKLKQVVLFRYAGAR